MHPFKPARWLLGFCLLAARVSATVTIFPVPPETQSKVFTATIDGRPAAVTHAAMAYHCLSFDLAGAAEISIAAPSDDYWASGIEVQPWRLNIRPKVTGRVATFSLSQPAKLSITRPGDHLAGAEMLFIFANAPERDVPRRGAGIRYYGPGVYRENIDARSGDIIYLAGGAVVFGSLNLWGVDHVKVFGRGTIVYDGPQNPADDNGWMHRRNWHAIVMDNAHHIEIGGIACIVRSRTWMIQMLNSRNVVFDDVKVIGGCPGNANQDGMDWLGGGDTLVRDCFFRASDDIFALQGNWLGYGEEALRTPGQDVTNIRIEKCVLSTSISNIVRVNWPGKTFNSGNFVLRDSDVIHMGYGACGVPFALFEIWADPGGRGRHAGYTFENLFLEDWYSLVQLRQPLPAIRDVTLRNIWALERPSMEASVLKGDVSEVRLENLSIAGAVVKSGEDLPLAIESGAQAARFAAGGSILSARFTVTPSVIAPNEPVTFDAGPSVSRTRIASYEWMFGDGARATGARVQHSFPDAEGTLRDGSGRFRVLLKVTDAGGNADWACHSAIVSRSLQAAASPSGLETGLAYRYYEGSFDQLRGFDSLPPAASGAARGLNPLMSGRPNGFALVYEGFLDVPADGGYIFLLMSRDRARVEIDSQTVAASPTPVPQVCGSVGNAVQAALGVWSLKAGKHPFRLATIQGKVSDGFALKWQGPGFPMQDIPGSAFFRGRP
jgi:hypothetical protein